jgi:hypothetical protein
MNVRVESVSIDVARLQVIGDYDGVNPVDVFEVNVVKHSETTYYLELRAGDAIEFTAAEEGDPNYPKTIFDGAWNSDRKRMGGADARTQAWEEAAASLRALNAIIEDEDEEDGSTSGARERLREALDAFDDAKNMDE